MLDRLKFSKIIEHRKKIRHHFNVARINNEVYGSPLIIFLHLLRTPRCQKLFRRCRGLYHYHHLEPEPWAIRARKCVKICKQCPRGMAVGSSFADVHPKDNRSIEFYLPSPVVAAFLRRRFKAVAY